MKRFDTIPAEAGIGNFLLIEAKHMEKIILSPH
jgi:hypothetical protein